MRKSSEKADLRDEQSEARGALDQLLADIRRCSVCASALPSAPRPIVQAALESKLLIIGQAPGSKAHETGTPWNDASGQRLREWIGVDDTIFYNPRAIALMPMGFCYPGKQMGGGDAPPRRECAALWHDRLRKYLGARRLMLLVGRYAQQAYLAAPGASMTEAVRGFRLHLPEAFPLPHPSWRSTGWMRRNPWFETDVLPALREQVRWALG